MLLRYKVDIEDIVVFNKFHHENSPTTAAIRKQLKNSVLLAITILSGLLYFFYQSNTTLILGLSVAVLFALTYPRKNSRLLDRQVRRLYGEGENAKILTTHQLELGDRTLNESSEYGAQQTAYSAIERVVLTESHAFIYIAALLAHVVPREKIMEGNFDEFIQAVGAKLKDVNTTSYIDR